MTTAEILAAAVRAKTAVAAAEAEQKNEALMRMAEELSRAEEEILLANREDLENARGKIPPTMLDRLLLTKERLIGMAEGIRQVAALEDPCGLTLAEYTHPKGMTIRKVTVPLGVVAIIYESRPNVTSDAAALCVKSGNACVLRCGKEAHRTCERIVRAMKRGLEAAGLTPDALFLVEDTSRESANALMRARGVVDLLIPRGGASLIRACVETATVPCIQTGTGICHIYAHSDCDIEKALDIIENAKTSRPSVCNAMEALLVHRDIAPKLLPLVKRRLVDDRAAAGKTPVELRLCSESAQWIPGTPAGPEDFDTEFLDYILAVKVVDGAEEAIAHIAAHSTGHSEAILTSDPDTAALFCRSVDSAAVYVNASTRFTDGGEFGLGCEMGISTQKLHARGPMGLRELTTYKYIINGNGQVR